MRTIETLASRLQESIDNWFPYNPDAKRSFHRHARIFLKEFALTELGLKPHEFDLRSNLAGSAISGEVTLHTDKLYIQVSAHSTCRDWGDILYRAVDSRKDYTGYRNHYASPKQLIERFRSGDSSNLYLDVVQKRFI